MQSYWHVRNCSLFQRLNETQLTALEHRSRQKKFPKGSSVYLPSDAADGTFLVAEGRVQICSTTPDGKQCILGFVEPGEVFGELSLIDSSHREERAEAIMNSNIILIPSDFLKGLMEESAELALGVTKLIGFRRKRIERRLRSLLFRNNRDRLTHLLLELAEQYGVATSDGIELSIRLSHQDLASIIGATRETVTTLLGEMQSEGLLRIKRQRLLIRDRRRLAGESLDTAPVAATPSPASSASQVRDSRSPKLMTKLNPVPAREM